MTTTDPTAPATPGEALRWYADHPSRADPPPWREQLRRWADELDAARATDPAPATPPEHQPGVDPDWCGLLAAEAADQLREVGMPVLAEHVEALEKWHRGEGSDAWPRGPLSTTPPAGTEQS